MNETLPILIPAAGEEPEQMMRGAKMRLLDVKDSQARQFALWGRSCIMLHNLLLELQMAAYSGMAARVVLGWRSIWAKVVQDDRAEAEKVYVHGKKRKDGAWIKEPGEGREEEREALKERRKLLKKGTRAYKEIAEKLRNAPARSCARP